MSTEIIAGEQATVKRKRGDVREDGMIFFRYKNGKEVWLSSEEFQRATNLQSLANRKYNKTNIKKKRESAKIYRDSHRDFHIQRTRDWRARNPDKVKSYYINNREKQIKSGSIARSKRYKNDPFFALICKYRALIRYAFKRIKTKKKDRSIDVLGCSAEQFVKHIESQFYDGMTWDSFKQKNQFGRCVVEIDHIIPISSANTEEDVLRLSHYTNLRPTWWWENQAKRNKMPDNP